MRFNLIIYKSVYYEIEDAIFNYSSISPQLGKAFEKAMQKALDDSELKPQHYFNLEDDIHRRIVIKGFPYAFIYSIDVNDVQVKMLFPMNQNPNTLWNRLV